MTDLFPGAGGRERLPTAGAAYDERLALLDAIRLLRAEVSRFVLAHDGPGGEALERRRRSVLALLDGYLVSRLQVGERPLLAVIGGPTGAGKSTLLNSLVGAPVSPASVLRPTTRTPVLLYNPVDERGLASYPLLPGLTMTTTRRAARQGRPGDRAAPEDVPPRQLRLVARQEVPPGLAILDSPDLDSWLSTNRELAMELLGVADLWIFATTGTDYADAIPWEILDTILGRRVTVAAVLNRMRPTEIAAVRKHFAQMLTERGLASTPVFTIPELALIDERIPYQHVVQLSNWLSQQSGVEGLRGAYLDRALYATLEHVLTTVGGFVDAAAAEAVAEQRLRTDVRAMFSRAREEIRTHVVTGGLEATLRQAWRSVAEPAAGGRLRRRLNAALRPGENPYLPVATALRTGVGVLVAHQVAQALEQVMDRWGGRRGQAPTAALPRTFPGRVDAVVVSWMGVVEDHVRSRHPSPGFSGRWTPETLAVASLALTAERADPAGPPAVARRALADRGAAHLGDDVEPLTRDLLTRLDRLVDEEEQRLRDLLEQAPATSPADGGTAALRAHLESLERLKRVAFTN